MTFDPFFDPDVIVPIGSVFSVSVDGNGTLACTGGEDDQALVWKVADGAIVFHCHGESTKKIFFP